MSLLKSVIAVNLVIVLAVASFIAGTRMAPRVMAFDFKTREFAPLVVPDGAKIFVVGPNGVEPGVLAGHSKDGKSILLLPPSMIDPQPPAQPQANHERFNHASNL
jgi:hypothetical protein